MLLRTLIIGTLITLFYPGRMNAQVDFLAAPYVPDYYETDYVLDTIVYASAWQGTWNGASYGCFPDIDLHIDLLFMGPEIVPGVEVKFVVVNIDSQYVSPGLWVPGSFNINYGSGSLSIGDTLYFPPPTVEGDYQIRANAGALEFMIVAEGTPTTPGSNHYCEYWVIVDDPPPACEDYLFVTPALDPWTPPAPGSDSCEVQPYTQVVEHPTGEWGIYPNPADDLVYFETEAPVDVVLYNNMGRVIASETAVRYLDVSVFPAGVYYLKIDDRNRIGNHVLVVR